MLTTIKAYIIPVTIPLLVVIFSQSVKLLIDAIKNKHFSWKNLFTTGGFPSVHSGMTSSVTTLVALHEGLSSILFAVSFVFMFLISFDAMNLRYEAGKHAHYLNSLRHDLTSVLGEENKTSRLKERIGHTPWEVFGGVII